MDGMEGWFNVATPLLAGLLFLLTRKGRSINSYLAVYFLASSLVVLLLSKLSLLESMGSGYFFGYSVFAAMFVTVFCGNVALSDKTKHKKMSWLMAIVMYLIVAINVGVFFESSPILWGIYSSVMLSLECILLVIGVLSSGILNGLFKLFIIGGDNSRTLNGSGGLSAIQGWPANRAYDSGEIR